MLLRGGRLSQFPDYGNENLFLVFGLCRITHPCFEIPFKPSLRQKSG